MSKFSLNKSKRQKQIDVMNKNPQLKFGDDSLKFVTIGEKKNLVPEKRKA